MVCKAETPGERLMRDLGFKPDDCPALADTLDEAIEEFGQEFLDETLAGMIREIKDARP